MPKDDNDPLRKWMNANKVWQMDLYRLLQKEDVSSIKDLRGLDKDTFDQIQKKAKQTGFMGGKRLLALYKNEKYVEKKKSKPKPKKQNTKQDEPELDEIEIKNIARQKLEPWMKTNKIWQLDLFNLFIKWEIMKKEDFLGLDEDDFDEFFKEAKQSGLMADKPGRLKALYTGKEYKKNTKKKSQKKQSSKPKQEDNEPTQEEIEQQAYDNLKPWMTKNKIWQRDLLNVFIEYEIYTPDEFKQMDKDTFDDFFTAAKQAGLMGQKPKLLKALYTGKEAKKSTKKKPEKKQSSKPKEEEEPTQEEIEQQAYDNLKPWMTKNKIWQRDLLNVFIEYEIYTPDEFKQMDKDTFDDFFTSAKQAGLMGQKPKLLKALYTGKSVSSKKKAKPQKKKETPKQEEEDPEEIERKAREKLEKWMNKGGFWQRDLLNLLIEYDVMSPSDFKKLDKDDFNELLKSAKSKGLMGKKVDNFKAAYK